MPDKIQYAIYLLIVALLTGCASGNQIGRMPAAGEKAEDHPATEATLSKVESLQVDLAALNRQANLTEARRVARTTIQYSHYLAEKYELVRPAVLHNVLVRMGIKDRGLCHHWTTDLMGRLERLDLKTYQLY